MGNDISVGASSTNTDLATVKNTTNTSESETISCVFTAKTNGINNIPTKVIPQVETADQVQKVPFESDLKAFSKLNLKEDAVPQKEVNGIKIYATGSKEKITTTTRDGQLIISMGENGQKILIPIGQMQPKGATVVYNGRTLAVSSLKDATIVGSKNSDIKNADVNNQMLAKNCSGCTFDMNDKVNGWSESRDDLVMDNCKMAKVLTGQNNLIVGQNGTNADVSYSSVVGKQAYENPIKDWINRYHTNIAYDDSSTLSSTNRGSINRDAHDPLVYDMVKTQGADFEANSYSLKDGTKLSAADYLLEMINKDAESPHGGSKSIYSEQLSAMAPKLSSTDMLAQLDHISKNH